LDGPSIVASTRQCTFAGDAAAAARPRSSVIVVEHDEETIRSADHIIDQPGRSARQRNRRSNRRDFARKFFNSDYLSRRARIAIPKQRTTPRSVDQSDGWLTVVSAAENNLKNLTVSFPLSCLTCVTGVRQR
jgi:excinuclease ABC subunit A